MRCGLRSRSSTGSQKCLVFGAEQTGSMAANTVGKDLVIGPIGINMPFYQLHPIVINKVAIVPFKYRN
jgi:hypothetical protein